jgi:hypothetical protein
MLFNRSIYLSSFVIGSFSLLFADLQSTCQSPLDVEKEIALQKWQIIIVISLSLTNTFLAHSGTLWLKTIPLIYKLRQIISSNFIYLLPTKYWVLEATTTTYEIVWVKLHMEWFCKWVKFLISSCFEIRLWHIAVFSIVCSEFDVIQFNLQECCTSFLDACLTSQIVRWCETNIVFRTGNDAGGIRIHVLFANLKVASMGTGEQTCKF